MPKPSRLEALQRRVSAQRSWIEEHGGSLHGYILRYGSKNDPEHYGDGGEAIYAADTTALREYETDLGRAQTRAGRTR